MEEDYVMIPGSGTKKIIRDVKKEIETAFLDYSMSVIVSRALPDVRDGLKPVHRRILYTMHERGNDPSHAYRKSADTVGAVLGSYHPHGDASVYDAMVRLAQDFSLRYPLVDGQGNFGSVDGDPPAAYRYTEARMSRMAVEMLTDIEKDTIDWDPNFDETKKEPSVLPCRFPNLLVNGSQGIAVGMATNIPPHNLSEVIDGCIAYIDDPDIDLPGLMEHIKGPDFPTAGIIMGRSGIRAAYATGRGKITLRGRATIEETKNGRTQIIITEIPYMVNKARLIENMADLVKEKRIEATPKAMILLEEKKAELGVEKLDAKTIVKTAGPVYIPTVVSMGLSTACTIGALKVKSQQNAALAAACTLSETALRTYQNKVVETIGAEKEQEIREAVALDKMAKSPEPAVIPNAKGVKTDDISYDQRVKCWESLSGNYFWTTRNAIERAINGVNKQLLSDFRVTENDLFDYLGMEHNRNGDLLGWDTDTTMEVETFYASKLDEDGMPCLVLDYRTPPKWLGY